MADQHYEYRSTETRTSGGAIAFIVGGLVVAVAAIAYFIFGGDLATSGVSSDPAAIEINNSAGSSAGADSTDGGAAATADTANDTAGAAATADTGSADATAGATASE
ncbi:hypothetical protein GCM10011360_07450 [Primorskyibacter flagellatus]|uniref:Uncharacterized protein n=1 Tax=Primorskyibacter flagellatus TaxID=1387277 RepID=A0A917A0L1_9RHOB|nr:hypothetical protein [Primorskyibacter flagellatus]GGE21347.1 hypothetical protein GCM10011360_07450 [Primorskyibacter flagellatus]